MSKINLLDSFARAGGDPVTVTLMGVDLTIRRDFTGAEVHDIIMLHTPEGQPATIKDQLMQLTAMLSTDDEKTREKFVTALLDLAVVEIQALSVELGKIAGIRGDDGNFLTGVQR